MSRSKKPVRQGYTLVELVDGTWHLDRVPVRPVKETTKGVEFRINGHNVTLRPQSLRNYPYVKVHVKRGLLRSSAEVTYCKISP